MIITRSIFTCLFAIIFGNHFHLATSCCTTEHPYPDDHLVVVTCSSINSADMVGCMSAYLTNASSSGAPLQVYVQSCDYTLFIDEFFTHYNMAGLEMESCEYPYLPLILYGRICHQLTTGLGFPSNGIKIVAQKSFLGCDTVTDLDLSFNQISKIHPDAFQDMTALEALYLQGNRIQTIESKGFQSLSSLVQLSLHMNAIDDVKVDAFVNVRKVQALYLNTNQLTTLPEGVLDSFGTQFALDISANPLDCVCSLQWLQTWLKANDPSSKATCATPHNGDLMTYNFCPATTNFPSGTTTTMTTPSGSNGGGDYNVNIYNFMLSENLTMTWQTDHDRVLILYSPTNENCSVDVIEKLFYGLTAGAHYVVAKNTNYYAIKHYEDDTQPFILVCVTSADTNISINNFECDANCRKTPSPQSAPDNNSSSESSAVVTLPVLLGVVLAVIVVALIVLAALLCFLKRDKEKRHETVCRETSTFSNRPLCPLPDTVDSFEADYNPTYAESAENGAQYVDLDANDSQPNDPADLKIYENTLHILQNCIGESDTDALDASGPTGLVNGSVY